MNRKLIFALSISLLTFSTHAVAVPPPRTCEPFDYDMIEVQDETTFNDIKMVTPVNGVSTREVLSDTSTAKMGDRDWRIMTTDPKGTQLEAFQDLRGYFDGITPNDIVKYNATHTPKMTSSKLKQMQGELFRHLASVSDGNESLSPADLLAYPDFTEIYGQKVDDVNLEKARTERIAKDKARVERILGRLNSVTATELQALLTFQNKENPTRAHIRRPTLPIASKPEIGLALPALCTYISYNTFAPIDAKSKGIHDVQMESLFMDQIAIEAIKSDSFTKNGVPPKEVKLAGNTVSCNIKPSKTNTFKLREGTNCMNITQTKAVIRTTRNTTERYLQFGGKAYWTTCSSMNPEHASTEWSVGELFSLEPSIPRVSETKVLSSLIQEPAYVTALSSSGACATVKNKLQAMVTYIEDKPARDKVGANKPFAAMPFNETEQRNYQSFCSEVIEKGVVNCDLAIAPAPATPPTPPVSTGTSDGTI